jgi:hypothetical protein
MNKMTATGEFMKILRFSFAFAILAALAVSAACKKPAPPPPPAPVVVAPQAAAVTVSGITLGSAVGADKRVVAPMSQFKPTDTIFAAVATTGAAASTTISVRWLYGAEGQLVHQESITVAPNGDDVTDFQISKPEGWPLGDYRVEISVDGKPAGSAAFQVAS